MSMAFWNRSSYLMMARLIPIVLILSAGFLWKYEKQIRVQTERRLKAVSDQLTQSQNELASAKSEVERTAEEKHYLVQQLGERDEHIRRLLAEMIRLLSGSGSVDLGEVLVRTQQTGAWDGVHQELQNIVSQPPMLGVPAVGGLGQMQVEERAALPAAALQVAAPTLFQTGSILEPLPIRNGQILTVNSEHRFVVISQGSQDGLKRDTLLDAFADGHKIGRLKVGTVYDRIATASILDGDAKLFREGASLRLDPASAA